MTNREAFNKCWSKYYKEHSWNYMDEELSLELAKHFWQEALEQPTTQVTEAEYPSKEEILKAIFDAVYAQYPKKRWQGLSDDEIEKALSGTDPNFIHGSCIQGILWAEAKLKEKNT